MRQLGDEDLILHYYGESPDPEAVDRAIESSAELAARNDALRAVLDAVPEPEVPELPTDYGARVWRELEPRLRARRLSWDWLVPRIDRRWALAGAAMLLVVVSFLAGRFSPRETAEPARTAGASASQKILLVTVAGHLERSEMLLLELTNARENGGLDLTAERELAQELSGANRLYRQAAERAGDVRVASLLDQLERLLIELAHAPDELPSDELHELQLRLEEGDLLFKVRVVGSRLRQETRTPPRAVDAGQPGHDI